MRNFILSLAYFTFIPYLAYALNSDNRVIESSQEIELNPANEVLTFGDLLLKNASLLKLEDTAGGEYVSLQAPDPLSSAYSLILPPNDGNVGQLLQTDGTGILNWVDPPSAFTAINDNRILRSDLGGNEIQESGVSIDDTDTLQDVNGINLTGASLINFTEVAEPSTPAASLARLYFDSTEKKLASKDDTGAVTIYGEGAGAGDVENSLKFPGFGNKEVLFSHTTGTGAIQLIGGHLDTTQNPSPFERLSTGTTHDHYACRTLPIGPQYEVGCYIKSTLDDIDVCFSSDATTDRQCNSSYDGSNEYKYVFQRSTPVTGEDVCLRIKSPSATDIDVDSCRIGEVKLSKAELSKRTIQEIFYRANSSTLTDKTGDIGFNLGNIVDSNPNAVLGIGADGTGTYFQCLKELCEVDAGHTFAQTAVDQFSRIDIYADNTTSTFVKSLGDSGQGNASQNWEGTSVEFTLSYGESFRFSVSGTARNDGSLAHIQVLARYIESSTNVLAAVDKDQPAKRTGVNSATVSDATITFLDFTDSVATDSFDPNNNFTGCGSGHSTTASSGCRWVAPRSGKVLTCIGTQFNGSTDWQEGETIEMSVYKNGVGSTRLDFREKESNATQAHAAFARGCAIVEVLKDDYLSAGMFQTSGLARTPSTSFREGTWDVSYIDAKALLAGLEDIGVSPALYETTTLQTTTSGVELRVNFGTPLTDKDSLVSNPTTDWKYTAPKDGVYEISAGVYFSSLTWGAGQTVQIRLRVNGTPNEYLYYKNDGHTNTGGGNYFPTGTIKKVLSKGDEIQIFAQQNSGSNVDINGLGSYISITKEEATLSAGSDAPSVVYDSGHFNTVGSATAGVYTDSGANVTLTPGTWHITAKTTMYIESCTGTGIQGKFSTMAITNSSNVIATDINGVNAQGAGDGVCNAAFPTTVGQVSIDSIIQVNSTDTYKLRFSSYVNSGSPTSGPVRLYDASSYGATTLKAVRY